MSDEEDYMSDKFLTGLQDVRPSLINNRGKKRQIEVELKHKEHNKKQKELKQLTGAAVDNERLQIALSKPLEQENKGFKLLAKMGYKPGQALGKQDVIDNSTKVTTTQTKRLIEPIGITIKSDRQGLGRETALKELKERRKKIREDRLKKQLGGETSIEDFRRRTTQKHEEKFVLNALRRCEVTCENLDLEAKLEKPEMLWFWPARVNVPEEQEEFKKQENENDYEDLEEEFSNQEKLEMLTNYLRTSYLFCYWCGERYHNEQDLNDNCPGLTKDEH
ncbi:G patch domain-containing protein 11-like [Cochliomyia hominivorax]